MPRRTLYPSTFGQITPSIAGHYGLAVTGNPFWENDINSKNEYAYLIISNKVFYIPNDKLDVIINDKPNPNTYQVRDSLDIVFEFPLYDKQRYGIHISTMMNENLNYMYYVNKDSYFLSRKGDNNEEIPIYKISESSLGSDTTMTFIPTIGISKFKYIHHGTIDTREVELVDYRVNNTNDKNK